MDYMNLYGKSVAVILWLLPLIASHFVEMNGRSWKIIENTQIELHGENGYDTE